MQDGFTAFSKRLYGLEKTREPVLDRLAGKQTSGVGDMVPPVIAERSNARHAPAAPGRFDSDRR